MNQKLLEISSKVLILMLISSPILPATQTITGNGLTLTYDDAACGGAGNASSCTSVMQSAFNKATEKFQLNGLKDYLKFMSSAQSIANRGQGVDYTTNPSLIVLGGSVGAGVDIGNLPLSEAKDTLSKSGGLSAAGYALQFSVMAGINLGFFKFKTPILGVIDLNRLTVYAHAAGYDFSSLLKQDGLTVKSSQFGIHTKYKVFEGKNLGFGTLNWGGLDFITGLTSASNELTYQKTFDQISSGDGSISNPQVRITPAGTINVTNSAFTVPLEVATSIRLLYVLSLFGGVGLDLNFGKSSVDVSLNSTSMTATVSGTTVNAGNMSAKASESGGGRFGDLRFFSGVGINLIPLKSTNVLSLIVQGNISTGGGYGVMAGVRAGW